MSLEGAAAGGRSTLTCATPPAWSRRPVATCPRRRSTPSWSTGSRDRRAFEARLAELGGKDEDAKGGYQRIKLDSYIDDAVDTNPDGPIGIVTVAGEIVDGKAPAGTAGGDSIAEAIEKGFAATSFKALVVRIDSPGGSVMASERIRQALLAAKEKKLPVVVSMGSVAASGGYWVATPGDFIFAEPSTITGSIGVFGILPSFQGTLTKLGLGADGIKTTPLSGEPDLLNGPSPEAGAADPDRGRKHLRQVPRPRRRRRGANRRPISTASPRAACGMAAPRASSGWSTGSAAWTKPSPRRPSWRNWATSAA